jgi:branched-chain amino acid transport system permease protein
VRHLIEQLINGIIIGSMYALVALGYTLVFGYLDKLNLAHGDVFMFGGYVGVFVLANGLPLWIAIAAAILVSGFMGLLIELLSFRKFKTHDAQITAALSTIALGMVITDVTQRIWGTEPVNLNVSPQIYTNGFTFLGANVNYIQLQILAISIILMVALSFTVQRTKYGRFMRAISENEVSSSLLGINAKRGFSRNSGNPLCASNRNCNFRYWINVRLKSAGGNGNRGLGRFTGSSGGGFNCWYHRSISLSLWLGLHC